MKSGVVPFFAEDLSLSSPQKTYQWALERAPYAMGDPSVPLSSSSRALDPAFCPLEELQNALRAIDYGRREGISSRIRPGAPGKMLLELGFYGDLTALQIWYVGDTVQSRGLDSGVITYHGARTVSRRLVELLERAERWTRRRYASAVRDIALLASGLAVTSAPRTRLLNNIALWLAFQTRLDDLDRLEAAWLEEHPDHYTRRFGPAMMDFYTGGPGAYFVQISSYTGLELEALVGEVFNETFDHVDRHVIASVLELDTRDLAHPSGVARWPRPFDEDEDGYRLPR